MDCSPPHSSVRGFSQAKYWSRLPYPSPEDLPDSGIKPYSPALAGGFFTTESPEKPHTGKKRRKKGCYGLHIIRNCSGLLHSCLMILKWLRSWFGSRSWVSSPYPPALNLFQHQALFKRVSSSHQVAKVLEFQLQHQSFQ